jgi:hypothetical protein
VEVDLDLGFDGNRLPVLAGGCKTVLSNGLNGSFIESGAQSGHNMDVFRLAGRIHDESMRLIPWK